MCTSTEKASQKQQMMSSQQYSSQEPHCSQDIRVQMGEKVHMKVHHPQHVRHAQ